MNSINIWAQETKQQVAMPTQHIQQLNSTPASVFKDPSLTFHPGINGKIRYHSQTPQHAVFTLAGKQTPQGKSGETSKASASHNWEAGKTKKVQFSKNNSFSTTLAQAQC